MMPFCFHGFDVPHREVDPHDFGTGETFRDAHGPVARAGANVEDPSGGGGDGCGGQLVAESGYVDSMENAQAVLFSRVARHIVVFIWVYSIVLRHLGQVDRVEGTSRGSNREY
jgi:hypothetical protein